MRSAFAKALLGWLHISFLVRLSNTTTLIVVVVVPIAFRTPTVLVFVPPMVPLTPASLPRPAQLNPFVICLTAVAAVPSDCLMKFVLRVHDPVLTSVDGFRMEAGS